MTDCKLIVKRKNSTTWLMGMVISKEAVNYNCGKCTVSGHLLSGGTRETSQHKFVEVIVRNVPDENDLHKLLIEQDNPLPRRKYKLSPQTTELDPYFLELLANGLVDVDYSVLQTFIELS